MKRVLSPLVLLLVGIVCFAPAVSADSGYTAIHGGEVSLDEFLVMGRDTPVPDASFRFTVAPGSAMAGTDRTLEVVPDPAGIAFKEGTGVTVNSDGSATVRFSPSDTAVNEASAPAGDGVHFDTTDNEDEKYVKKTLTVDLSGVSFTDVGVYRYVLTEEVPAERTLRRDGNPVRYLDVYVTDNNGSLGIPVVFWHTAAVAPGKTGEDMT